ncbi:hypothetical protein CGT92_07115 [Vibrio metoecus]|uniref:Uncharacterized protein n=1 Tax=Vibrio metoecus TaxID=1481663 RepID=A0A271VSV4_VIBMT|nr:hypothetical protein CGU03_10110 [Vibrio metoecus]PAR23640.1 hypothetical protein CGU02_13605 [Vibrio metoecus]PAR26961.1 hypothetical protein CGU00_16280 [Vibrio metoecus]PAR30581.1 hypothetical protein CGT99_15900 [Vibrio metoecus]PAR35059.1 hypothetical protein CGT97_13510 [Vibrio metoecus]
MVNKMLSAFELLGLESKSELYCIPKLLGVAGKKDNRVKRQIE